MSNCIDVVSFNDGRLTLEMAFSGDDYEKASVKFRLEGKGRTVSIEESATIPVKSLFDVAYLINVSLRRNAMLIEQDLLRIQEFSKVTGQSFQHIAEENKDGKENQEK